MMVVERSSVTRKSVRPKSGPLDRFWLPEMVPPDRQKMVAPQLPIVVLAGPNLGCHERSCFPRYGGPEGPILSTIHNPQSTIHNLNVQSTIHNLHCAMCDRQSTIHVVQCAIDNLQSTLCNVRSTIYNPHCAMCDRHSTIHVTKCDRQSTIHNV